MTPTQSEIERVARELIAEWGHLDRFAVEIAQWHLERMAEQRAKYERLVQASIELINSVGDTQEADALFNIKNVLSDLKKHSEDG